jgi:cellulose synthase/poly-beta-1,6-N-acetylglucosamine synthase-like glycosyltransferase
MSVSRERLPNARGGFSLGVGPFFRRSLPSLPVETPPYLERLLDALPGLLAWLSIAWVIIGAVHAPWVVLTVAALLATYMALRLTAAAIANLTGMRRTRRAEATDWQAEYGRRARADSLAWHDVQHLVVIPNYKEDIDVLRQTLGRLAESPLARTQVVVCLAMESADPNAHQTAQKLREAFQGCFRGLLATFHPRGLIGEVPGKSSNEAWAVRQAKRELVDLPGGNLDHMVVTIADADSRLHPRYLEALTCHFATAPHAMRHATFWQAPIRYHNNVWQIHPSLALVNAYSSAWELAYLAGGWWHALPISTYSLSLRQAESVGYWDTDVIAEDVHMFLKCYAARRGRVRIAPIYLPFSGYAVTGDNFLDACANRYQQTLRHAWGAREIGYSLRQMIRTATPIRRCLRVWLRVTHDHLMAGAGWAIMTVGGQLTLLLNPWLFRTLSVQLIVLQVALAVVTLVSLLFWLLDLRQRPPRPHRWRPAEVPLMLVSFAALAVLVLFLVALPALEAQTRLMLGVPLRYRVARKV